MLTVTSDPEIRHRLNRAILKLEANPYLNRTRDSLLKALYRANCAELVKQRLPRLRAGSG